MLTEELRARIALLNRVPTLMLASRIQEQPSDLASLVPGEVIGDGLGEFYRVRRAVVELNATDLAEMMRQHVKPADAAEPLHPELRALGQAFPSRALFLDLETCGFSGAPLFLIGMLHSVDGELIVEQLFARDYAEEPAVLRYLWGALSRYDVLVTFNGKAFDWPFIVDRSVAHRLVTPGHGGLAQVAAIAHPAAFGPLSSQPQGVALTHCDLLHLARRYWKAKHELPNCRLQTLEVVLCGRYRRSDIPGWMIGDTYHRFVRSRDGRHIERVLRHNAVDLITLAQLSLLMMRDFCADSSPYSLQPTALSCQRRTSGFPA